MKYQLIIMLFLAGTLSAQNPNPRFWEEIQAFKKQDSLDFPEKNQILFAGSSSFRLWKDVQQDFPGYPILNRGFGGSTLPDLIYYAEDVIRPYQPRQVVIYCGENDLASGDSVTAAMVVDRFRELFGLIRKNNPQAKITFVSMKPSPSRLHLKAKVEAANAGIRNFLKKQKRTSYVDIYQAMLKADGSPQEDLFLEDRLHMNAKGYGIWRKAIRRHLVKR